MFMHNKMQISCTACKALRKCEQRAFMSMLRTKQCATTAALRQCTPVLSTAAACSDCFVQRVAQDTTGPQAMHMPSNSSLQEASHLCSMQYYCPLGCAQHDQFRPSHSLDQKQIMWFSLCCCFITTCFSSSKVVGQPWLITRQVSQDEMHHHRVPQPCKPFTCPLKSLQWQLQLMPWAS